MKKKWLQSQKISKTSKNSKKIHFLLAYVLILQVEDKLLNLEIDFLVSLLINHKTFLELILYTTNKKIQSRVKLKSNK